MNKQKSFAIRCWTINWWDVTQHVSGKKGSIDSVESFYYMTATRCSVSDLRPTIISNHDVQSDTKWNCRGRFTASPPYYPEMNLLTGVFFAALLPYNPRIHTMINNIQSDKNTTDWRPLHGLNAMTTTHQIMILPESYRSPHSHRGLRQILPTSFSHTTYWGLPFDSFSYFRRSVRNRSLCDTASCKSIPKLYL